MTDFEILQAILDEIKSVKQEVNTKLDNLEQDNKEIRQELQNFKQEVNTRFNDLDKKFNNLDEKVNNLDEKVNNLEKEVKLNTIALETTVKECIDLMGEGYQANFEKIDRLNLDSMKSKINQLEMLYKINSSEIERLKLKIG